MELIPGQRRRLAAEQAIYRRFISFRECNRACQRHCVKRGLDITFSDWAVSQYIGCHTNFSMQRVMVLADVLGVTNIVELDEVFIAPDKRGEGLYWVGSNGNKVKDIDLSILE